LASCKEDGGIIFLERLKTRIRWTAFRQRSRSGGTPDGRWWKTNLGQGREQTLVPTLGIICEVNVLDNGPHRLPYAVDSPTEEQWKHSLALIASDHQLSEYPLRTNC
jgi:hypothetical protein